MKLNRITAVLLAFFLSFSLIGMNAQHVSAVKANEAGIHVSGPEKYYDSESGKYCMKVTLDNQGYCVLRMSAYLYNADGKCIVKYENKGNYYYIAPGEKNSMTFRRDYSKMPSGTCTLVYNVTAYSYYDWNKEAYRDISFTWKWKINKDETSRPSISFKEMTYHTLKSGRVVPRINVKYQNLKGQSKTYYFYDEYGYLVRIYEGGKTVYSSGTTWLEWNGVSDDGVQYPSGYYTVEVAFSNGMSISKEFYFDFSQYSYG